jgi:glycine/D-amino acid oxidase-like deaminating enzyme
MRLDVLIFGGGAAGLWCLDRLRRTGYHAILLESTALGQGQTIKAQGIIHGGGKYALRGVRDFEAVRATREMPERWRRCLAGDLEPNLTGAKVLADRCYLWLPRGSATAWLQSWGFISALKKAGLFSTPPERVPKDSWPAVLRDSALAVYTLAEPVIATASLLETLASHHRKCIFKYDGAAAGFFSEEVRIAETVLKPRSIVLAAGEGNAELLRQAQVSHVLMQCRPLAMVLLKGPLSPLFGHCVVGGKTQLTITAPRPDVWQVGGEIAEQLAHEENLEVARKKAIAEIRRWFPALDFARLEIAIYRAVRAEARTNDQRRPSGVHAGLVAPRTIVAWPTKLALAPVLAEEVCNLVSSELGQPGEYDQTTLPLWPGPPVARYPWEEVEWFPAH